MATKAETALATAFSFLDDVGKMIRNLPDDPDAAVANRSSILNTIALASRKIAEAEQLDTDAVYELEDRAFNISMFKSMALDAEGFVYSICNDEKKALQIFDQAISLYPENAMAWFHKGLSLASLLRKEEALFALNKAIEYDGDNIEYHKSLEQVRSISGAEIATAHVVRAGQKTSSVLWYVYIGFLLLPFFLIIGGFINKDYNAVGSGFGLLVVVGMIAIAVDKVKSFFS